MEITKAARREEAFQRFSIGFHHFSSVFMAFHSFGMLSKLLFEAFSWPVLGFLGARWLDERSHLSWPPPWKAF